MSSVLGRITSLNLFRTSSKDPLSKVALVSIGKGEIFFGGKPETKLNK